MTPITPIDPAYWEYDGATRDRELALKRLICKHEPSIHMLHILVVWNTWHIVDYTEQEIVAYLELTPDELADIHEARATYTATAKQERHNISYATYERWLAGRMARVKVGAP